MLKRLRPVSPPPSTPSIPLVSDPSDVHHRESKRRRILPPSLDGQSRRSLFRTDEDDGEEDDDQLNLSERNASGVGPSGSTVHNTEYESANTVLHDLHALHRHRLIFSSPSTSFLHPQDPPMLRSLDKSYLSPIPHYSPAPDTSGKQDFGCELPLGEVQSVKERYEDTNRLLGSLFLTRRKQLDPYNT